MSTHPEIDSSAYPYLQGNYQPVMVESDFDQGEGGLRVEGKIPDNLLGAFMRNGPNIAWQPNHYVYPADDRLCGLPYSFAFAAASTQSWDEGPNHAYNATIAYDMDSGKSTLWDYGEGCNAGEPVHIPNPDSEREQDGYLMSYVYSTEQGAFLSILSAGDLERGPMAKVYIPARVPNGFHANWMANVRL